MKPFYPITLVLLVATLNWGCSDQQPEVIPAPQELTRDAVGYFCGMTVLDHNGPKGQVFLTDREQPLWFTSVRDTIAFTLLPGEPKNISAIYVTDIGHASWDQPEPGTWINARKAYYVIGSDRLGGMQAPEIVPFATRRDAQSFIEQHGGEIHVFTDIPRTSILESGD
ncbi:MAG TPA: copper resistance protein CopZ [Gammaproteobacteria bacterium]|nr:copper resistance protein CopZ [Gammaproteobacteria bacterium]